MLSSEFRIRSASVEDCGSLTRIAREAKASWGYPPEWLREWEKILTVSPEYIRLHTVLVAARGDEILGLIALEEGTSDAEVGHLWVATEAQGRGVGRALLRDLMEIARSRGWASVRIESDPHARRFYEAMGAVHVGDADAPVAGVTRTLPVLQLRL